MMKKLNSIQQLHCVLKECVVGACNSLRRLQQLSEVDKFYWHFITLCCNHIQPNPENLDKLTNYELVVDQLGKIHRNYCDINKINKVIDDIPHEINDVSNTDIKEYFKWILKMQMILSHWKEKFNTGEFNYDDIFTYAIKVDQIAGFAEALHVKHLAYNANKISHFKEEYSKLYAKLCTLLVKNSKDSGW